MWPDARHENPDQERLRTKAHASVKGYVKEIIGSAWKDAKLGRILFCAETLSGEQAFRNIVSSPPARVPKLNPDRTVSSEGRLIWDGRTPNGGCSKHRHHPALQPTHSELCRSLLWLSLQWPGLPLLLAKKDISAAFRWI